MQNHMAELKVQNDQQKPEILIVDDIESNRRLVIAQLERTHQVEPGKIDQACCYQNGLEKYLKHRDSLRVLIIDFQMPPGLDGLYLAEEILKDNARNKMKILVYIWSSNTLEEQSDVTAIMRFNALKNEFPDTLKDISGSSEKMPKVKRIRAYLSDIAKMISTYKYSIKIDPPLKIDVRAQEPTTTRGPSSASMSNTETGSPLTAASILSPTTSPGTYRLLVPANTNEEHKTSQNNGAFFKAEASQAAKNPDEECCGCFSAIKKAWKKK